MAAIEGISRFDSSRKLVAYLGLDPKSANRVRSLPATGGSPSRAKLRRAELDAGAPPLPKRHGGKPVRATAKEREAARELVQRAEAAYRRLVADCGGAYREVDLTFIRNSARSPDETTL